MTEVLIRSANQDEIDLIVNIHIISFHGFFLTMLGESFLKKMYSAFLVREYGLMRVAVDSNHAIVGFSAGTLVPELYFSSLRKKMWFSFLVASIPGIINNPIKVLRKLYYAMFYKGDSPAAIQKAALLSSIAVLPSMAGKSVGKALLADFEQQIMRAGVNCLYLTTDKHGNDAVVGFYTKAGYQIESEFTQPDGRQMLRLTKSL